VAIGGIRPASRSGPDTVNLSAGARYRYLGVMVPACACQVRRAEAQTIYFYIGGTHAGAIADPG
jgi:hypothetical protein